MREFLKEASTNLGGNTMEIEKEKDIMNSYGSMERLFYLLHSSPNSCVYLFKNKLDF